MESEFESYLDEQLAPAAEQLARRAKRVATLSSRLAKAASGGDMRNVDAALRDLKAIPVEEVLAPADAAGTAFDYRKYLAEGFARELEADCREAGIPLEGHFPSYFVFPFPVRVDVENPSVIVNRKRVTALRPSALVEAIKEEKERLERSPFNLTEFLTAIFGVWQRMNAQQSLKSEPPLRLKQPQPLKQVYRELVPFARWRRDYPESFFAYDVQRLLLSPEKRVGEWECALDRGRASANAVRLVDRDGQERFISTVNFVEVSP